MADKKTFGLSKEQIHEASMVELAYLLLKQKGEPMLYQDIYEEVAQIKGMNKEEKAHFISQLYTEITIDGRYICVGRSLWGLKKWYSLDQATDSAVAANVKEDDFANEELEEFEEEPIEENDAIDDDEDAGFHEFDADDEDFEDMDSEDDDLEETS
ncbi:DNA-directed RNA polymerase subunit delta [Mechercharimyces sp. CAU 1602]|uniref:DNA-directed RNA polymerase subunit delta n=1 Tax=Mechercharimyces sp. CAU 1602 TaxID=2973933 RepID=UPI0021631C70|nr:DNA-directed RNA polymerase subunit delta [Mechercharimyces sp. CAU 1602]MCS1352331.1 DNA-directed RNA polymerase subunit delta [Mechercharimyces sp. CAU 1602]